MNHLFISLFVAIITTVLLPLSAFAQNLRAHTWNENLKLERVDVGGISVCLPNGCEYSDEVSKPDEGRLAWIIPDKSFMFFCCLYNIDESVSQEERLIGEAAEMDFEITGDGDIAFLKLSSDKYLSFSFTDEVGIGICHLFPETQTGVCVCVIIPNATDESTLIPQVLMSIRLSEEQ